MMQAAKPVNAGKANGTTVRLTPLWLWSLNAGALWVALTVVLLPVKEATASGCATPMYDVSSLLGLSVQQTSADQTTPAIASAAFSSRGGSSGSCPLALRITVQGTVDSANDFNEDMVSILVGAGTGRTRYTVFNSLAGVRDDYTPPFNLQAQTKTASITVNANPGDLITLCLDAMDGDGTDTAHGGPVRARVTNVEILGGGGCLTSPGSGGPGIGGSGVFNIGLGTANYDASAGVLGFWFETPDSSMCTPAALRYNGCSAVDTNTSYPGAPAGMEFIVTNGAFRQILAPAILADIVTNNSSSYEIRCYAAGQVGAKVNGVYAHTGDPFVIWGISNSNGGANCTNLLISETRGCSVMNSTLSYASNIWSLSAGDGSDVRTHSREVVSSTADGNGRTNEVLLDITRDSGGAIVKCIRETRVYFDAIPKITERVVDPYGMALTNRWWYNSTGFLMATLEADGKWSINYPDATFSNLVGATILPWLNTSFPADLTNNPSGDHSAYLKRTRSTTGGYSGNTIETMCEYVGGSTLTEKTTITCTGTGLQETVEFANSGNNVTTKVWTADNGKRVTTLASDGTIKIYTKTNNAVLHTCTETTLSGAPNSSKTNITSGTRTVRVTTEAGNLVSENTYSVPGDLLIGSEVVTSSDNQGRPTRIDYLDGTYVLRNYTCCGIESERDREGVWTYYNYDSLKRIARQTRAGVSTTNLYDAADRLLASWREDGQQLLLLSSNVYDSVGRLIASTDAAGGTTYYEEDVQTNGFTIRTTTHPDNSTTIARSFLDGREESRYGTAVHASSNEYGLVSAGGFTYRYAKTFKLGPNGETNEWVMSLTDMLGRPYETVYPDGAFSFNVYNSGNQLVKTVDADAITNLFAYSNLGKREYAVLDMNGNGTMDFGGTDRVTRTFSEYGSNGTVTVSRAITYVYPTHGSTNPLMTSIRETGMNRMENWDISFGRTNRVITTWIDSTTRVVTSVSPDGSWSESAYRDGRIQTWTNHAADASVLGYTRHFYDSAGRQSYTLDAQGRVSSNTYDQAGQVVATTLYAPGMSALATGYAFDDMGRVESVMHPDGGVVSNEYYITGELKKTWGVRTYPVEYVYDSQGRMTNMVTWQDFDALSGTATTRWVYDSRRGFMTAKIYADGTTNAYTYTLGGKLSSRIWARRSADDEAISTDYKYNAAGDLASVAYSDGTPGVTNVYDRLGRLCQVLDGTGDRRIAYNSAGQILEEVYITPFNFTAMGVLREYDSLGRLSLLAATVPRTGVPTNAVTYTYDAASRLKTVSFGSNTVTYSYVTNSSLIGSIVFNNGVSNVLFTSKQYDGLNQLTNIVSTIGGQPLAAFAYGYNLANQRTNCVWADGSSWEWGYDSLGQLTNGNRRWSDGQSVDGQQYAYRYDDIGNRLATGRGTPATIADYTANLLNQYTQRTVPGEAWIQGDATTNVGVQVNGAGAERHDEFFSRKLSLTNTTQSVYGAITVKAVGTNGSTVVTNEYSGHVFVPKTPELFTYDADGNLLADGRWTNTWDAENRLIRMETFVEKVGTGVPPVRLDFAYDSQSRRVRKQVFTWSQTITNWAVSADCWYVYDGWNLIHEERRPDTQTRRVDMDYVWGIDLSGSMQGAGGIGGLVAVQSSLPIGDASIGDVVYTCYDANGNLTDLVSPAAIPAAHYEYDPYGNTLTATGPAAKINPFRFSSKYTDDETGLVYYGYRYYSPGLGRWVSRDPIQEKGGLALYGFCFNNSVDRFDKLGQIAGVDDLMVIAAVGAIVACTAAISWMQSREGQNAVHQLILQAATAAEALARAISAADAKCERCRERTRGCRPCTPVVAGIITGQLDPNPGHGQSGEHIDLLLMYQSPYPVCRCSYERHFAPPIPGSTFPLGILPTPPGPAGGGGPQL